MEVLIWLVVEPHLSEKYESQMGLWRSQDMEKKNIYI